jgi:hypothetical protein
MDSMIKSQLAEFGGTVLSGSPADFDHNTTAW